MSFRGLRSTALAPIAMSALLIITLNTPALAQWSAPVRISEPGGCWDPQILAQGDTLHVVYENTHDFDKISYVRSADAGESWSDRITLSERLGSTLFPRIVRNGERLMALWKQIFDMGPYRFDIGYALSQNSGVTWTGPFYILNPNWAGIQSFAAAASDSLVNVIFSAQVGLDMVFFDAISTDFGESWSWARQIFSALESGRTDMACSDSLIHFSWGGRFNPNIDWETYYLRSTDGGVTWSGNRALSEVDQFHSYNPAICANEIYNVDLTWMDFKRSPYSSTGDIFTRKSDDHGNNWIPEVQITESHRSWLSDIFSQGDTLFVAWQDARPENGRFSIYFSQSTDGGQTWSEEFRLDADSCESREPALAASHGRVYATWAETRYSPDTSGLFFSRRPGEPDAVVDQNGETLPLGMSLLAYPNPFNSSTIISVHSEKGGEVGIYNSTGQLVASFVVKKGGSGKVVWDATDMKGRRLSAGVYFANLLSVGHSKTIKLIYVK